MLRLDPAEYERIIRAWDDTLWGARGPFMSVNEAFIRTCPARLLVLPGSDPLHPTETAQRIWREAPQATCLDVDARASEKLDGTKQHIREFLRAHAE